LKIINVEKMSRTHPFRSLSVERRGAVLLGISGEFSLRGGGGIIWLHSITMAVSVARSLERSWAMSM
jgi:hypothetical protein